MIQLGPEHKELGTVEKCFTHVCGRAAVLESTRQLQVHAEQPMKRGKYQTQASNSISQRKKKFKFLLFELLQIQARTWFLWLSYSPLLKKLYLFFLKESHCLELQIFWRRKTPFQRKDTHFCWMVLPDLSAFNVHKKPRGRYHCQLCFYMTQAECWSGPSHITQLSKGLLGGQSSGRLDPESSKFWWALSK